MLGRQHLTLSLATAGIWIAPTLEQQPTSSLLLAWGVAIGALIPDVDATKAAIFNNQTTRLHPNLDRTLKLTVGWLFPVFGYLTKYLIFKPALTFLNTVIPGYHFKPEHRGFAHTWLGVLAFTFLTWLYTSAILEWAGYPYQGLLINFTGGYGLGALLHLLQDSCTSSGIQWFQPFSQMRLKGSLDTQSSSFRPALLFYGLVLGMGLTYYWPALGDPAAQMVVAVGGSAGIWGLFLFLARVQ